MTLTITVVNVNDNCSPVANAMVDIWQCDDVGHYSEYTQPGYDGRSETFLRGIQVTDSNGRVTFTTTYPGWYAGRATHIHVEVTVGGRSVKVTQIAFPDDVTATVYRTGVYAARGQNPTSNASDSIFADSLGAELAAISGDSETGERGARREIMEMNRAREIGLDKHLHTTQGCRRQPAAQVCPARRRRRKSKLTPERRDGRKVTARSRKTQHVSERRPGSADAILAA